MKINKEKNPVLIFISSIFISFLLAFFIYIYIIQTPILSKREFAFSLLLWLAFTPLLFLLLTRFLLPALIAQPRGTRRAWLLLSLAVGVFFSLASRSPQLILLLPRHSLQVLVPAGAAERTITLEYATALLGGDISFSQVTAHGNWERVKTYLVLSGAEPGTLAWSGRTGETAKLVFSDSPALAGVQVGWDGKLIPLETVKPYEGQVNWESSFSLGWQGDLAGRLITGFITFFLCLVLCLLLARVRLKAPATTIHKKGYWLLYTLPMIGVWGIYLLTFFPGMMSTDSFDQWTQLVTGQFNNAHPVFHTLTMWLVTRVWFSPAAVALFQIICLALTVAWGIRVLDEQGIPRWASWGLSVLFAILPINGNMVIALWKDILYSTSLLLLSIIFLKIVFTSGGWLNRHSNWVWLGLVCVLVSSFRHNGIPVAFLSLIVLYFFYRWSWKNLLGGLVLLVGMWYLFQGPFLNLIHAEKPQEVEISIFIHHIAAHMNKGAPLSPDEQAIADEILPPGNWRYNCCTWLNIKNAQGFSDARNEVNFKDIQKLEWQLALKEPGVEIAHQLCISAIVWEIPNHCVNRTLLPASVKDWVRTNQLNLKEDSLIPGLLPWLSGILLAIQKEPNLNGLLSPSIFLFQVVFISIFTAIKRHSPKIILFAIPALLQSAVLAVVNISDNFRYQYGVVLIGLFSLGLLIYALTSSEEISAEA
jgi:hypothetical protein